MKSLKSLANVLLRFGLSLIALRSTRKFDFFFKVILFIFLKLNEALKSSLELIDVNITVLSLVGIALLDLLISLLTKSQILLQKTADVSKHELEFKKVVLSILIDLIFPKVVD